MRNLASVCAKFRVVTSEAEKMEIAREAATGGRRLLPGLSVKDGYTRHPFDVAYGVKTSGLIAGRHLESGHQHDRHCTAYYGVAPSVFRSLLGRWRQREQLAPINEYTFVDLGAGMGRAVMLASEYSFREVIGVELHPTLLRMAKQNLTVWRRQGKGKAPMCMVQGDAVEFCFPPGRA